MNVVTLDNSSFEEACYSLANKVAETSNVKALVGIRSGGATVAKLVFSCLEKQGVDLEYYEAGASRYATATKNSDGMKLFFRYVPCFVLDWLRVIEYYIVKFRMRLSADVERSVCLDTNLVFVAHVG